MLLKNKKVYWCRILGDPSPGFDKTNPKDNRWSFEVSLDKEDIKELTALGCKSRIRNKGDERGDFLQFIRKAVKRDGALAKPIKVVDHRNEPWDQSKLIGNGSIINVAYTINESAFNGKKFLKPSVLSVQIWDYVPYEGKSAFEEDRTRNSIDTSEDTVEEEWS